MKPVRLTREVDSIWMIKDAVLRSDGIHFIGRDGAERLSPAYQSIEEMNGVLKKLGFPLFEISPNQDED